LSLHPPSPVATGQSSAITPIYPLPICHGPLGLVLTQRNPLLRMTVGPGREASPSAGPHWPSFRVWSVRFPFDPIARAAGRRPIGAVRRWGPVTPNTPIGRCQMRRGSVVPDVGTVRGGGECLREGMEGPATWPSRVCPLPHVRAQPCLAWNSDRDASICLMPWRRGVIAEVSDFCLNDEPNYRHMRLAHRSHLIG
jgi:hypothetical protein